MTPALRRELIGEEAPQKRAGPPVDGESVALWNPEWRVFAPEFDRAYVSCAGADRVDAIDTSTYELLASIPIPARNPSALCYRPGRVFVAPLRSGNQTAPRGAGPGRENEVVAIGSLAGNPAIAPLPVSVGSIASPRGLPRMSRTVHSTRSSES